MNNKKKILWISPYAPYDKVSHAGGKVHNYYIKYFHQSGNYDITLLSLCLQNEENDLDLDDYGIKNHIYVMDRSGRKKFTRRAVSAWSYVNPFDKYAGGCLDYERGKILKMLGRYKKEGNVPDLVILQWTFAVLLIPKIKANYPNCKIIAIEEDVTFLGYMRKWEGADTGYGRWFWNCRYKRMKSLELEMLRQADLIITNNPKDTRLLMEQGLSEENIFTSVPYFDDYSYVKRKVEGRDILFYGAMSRAENYQSAIWFIDKVMPLLRKQNVKFVVVGSSPDEALMKRKSDQVEIVGYAEDVAPYFQRSVCFVAPLLLGAGIKIKILEAMSSGIPVLTNSIGIEGIPAADGQEYFHCEGAEEYAEKICEIIGGEVDVEKLAENAKTYMRENYHLSDRLDELMNRIQDL